MSAVMTLGELARRLGGEFEGDGETAIRGVAGIRDAGAGQVAFLANPRYAPAVAQTRASAVIVARGWKGACPASLLRVDDPARAFSEVAAWFAPAPIVPPPGVHPTAVIAPDAELGEGVSIGPHGVVEPGARIGARCVFFAGCYVGHGTVIGEDGRFYPHVSIREGTRIGARAIVHNGAVIGSEGFGFVEQAGERHKVPQTGVVVVGDDVEIGANSTIDRARFGQTRIGNGVKLDNLVHIAHNVVVGDHCVMAALTGIAGSSVIGARCMFGGQAGAAGHVTIGDGVIVAARGGVTKDIPAGTFVSGFPAAPHDKALRLHAHMMRLPELKQRVAELEKRIAELEARPR